MAESVPRSSQLEMLCNRVRKNQRHLRKWAKRDGVRCFRLYDRDIPEIPLAVDWYQGYLHVAEYKSRREMEEDWAVSMAAGLAHALGVADDRVFVKTRERQRGTEQYKRFAHSGSRIEVDEGGLRFYVNLSDYLDTGLFLDHRITRSLVRSEAADKDVLNLFCYTGSFSVYAAAGGARTTTSIDLSNTYTAWARDNLALNGLSEDANVVEQGDVLGYLADPGEPSFDLAVVDPPTFSNSKRMERSFEVQRDHVWLLQRTIERMRPGGIIYFSNNYRRFKLAELDLAGVEVSDISAKTIPPDFRNQRIHHCFRLVVRDGR